MSFRFRKSINLGKGFRVNIGKSGGRLSFGGQGFRQSISTAGTARTTFGIPGTGLSYSKSFSAKKLLGKKEPLFEKVSEGSGLSPQQEVEAFTSAIALITGLHTETDYPQDLDWNEVLKEEPPFGKGEDGPNTVEAKQVMEQNKPGFFKRLLGGGAIMTALENNVEQAKKLDQELLKQWENNKVIAGKVLTKDTEGYMNAVEDLRISEELSQYIRSLDLEAVDEDTVSVDMTLSITDFIPEEYKTLTPTGRLSVKKYTKTDYYEIASRYVAGAVFRVARDLFVLFPIADTYIHVTEEDKNPYTGKKEKKLILSVKIERSELEKLSIENLDPFEALVNFHHEVDFGKTSGFDKVEKVTV